MPRPGKRWRHIVTSTRNSWLKGDPRGFRTRYRQIHSSGDYRNPPPNGEHSGLHRYFKRCAGKEVHIGYPERAIIGRAMVQSFLEMDCRALCVSVSKVHAHALVEMDDHLPTIRAQMGEAKRSSSRAVKRTMPGKIWAVGGRYGPIDTPALPRDLRVHPLRPGTGRVDVVLSG